jgi:hypothetical protein
MYCVSGKKGENVYGTEVGTIFGADFEAVPAV